MAAKMFPCILNSKVKADTNARKIERGFAEIAKTSLWSK